MLLSEKKTHFINYLFILISSFSFVYIEYFLPRSNFPSLVLFWILLFALSYYLTNKSNLNTKDLFYLGILFRGLLLIATPPLSQDFNRFIWDGRLIFEGLNPYLTTPDFFFQNNISPIKNAHELYKAMGNLNATNYTNYPPISQLGYFIAALFGHKSILVSIVVMRIQLIIADVGIFHLGKKILKFLKLPEKNIFIYFLNPFIILELTGNLHYEPVMIFFLITSLYYLLCNKWIISAISLGVSINVKLLPLIFIPVFASYFFGDSILKKSLLISFKRLLTKRKQVATYLMFCIIALITNIILFTPFYNSKLIANYTSSIGLWFKSFEFNASIYYVIRWIGYQIVGWNIIGTVGRILPLFVIFFITILSVTKNNNNPKTLFRSLLFSATIYLLLSTTVHPWYLSIPIAISIFTNFKYIYVWTISIILSYYAYSNPSFTENLFLVAIEYTTVFIVFIFDMSRSHNKKAINL